MSIEIRNVSKNFGDFRALKDVSLTIDSGELVALLGPSGVDRAMLCREVVGLAVQHEGGAVTAAEIEARRQALVPLERAARHALVAACSV